MTPGQRVREIRQAMGWSTHDLASACQMRESFLVEIEEGMAPKIHSLTWTKLANHLGVTLRFLLGEEDLPANADLMDQVPDEYRWFVKWTMRLVVSVGTLTLIISLLIAGCAIAEQATSFLRGQGF